MRARVTLVLGIVTLVGCSSPNTNNSAEGSSGTSTSSAGTAGGGTAGATQSNGGTGTAQGGSGAGQPAGGATAIPKQFGQIILQSRPRGTNNVAIGARFISDAGTPSPECTGVQDGPCWSNVCNGMPTPAMPTYASAGTVTITSPEVMGTGTLTPSADNSYPTPSQMFFDKVFDGGEHIQFKAAGGTVPAFEGEVDVPFVLLLSQPDVVAGAGTAQPSIDVPRSQDLSLVWTRGVKDVVLYVSAASSRADGQPGMASFTCQFPSEPGSAVVKSSLLQQLYADVQVNLFTAATKVMTAGDYSITLAVSMPVATPDKAIITHLTLK
jgi:hypothetical protein